MKINLMVDGKLKFLPGLAEYLGFKPGDFRNDYPSLESSYKTFESPNVADPNFDFRLFYVYSDIIEPQIVGDTVAPLLRVITVKGEDSTMIHEMFDRPHYISLTRQKFQTIGTDIRIHTFRLVSLDRGTLIVKFHFRQKSLS